MIYTYSIEETYTPKAKRIIEIKNATLTAMEAFAKKIAILKGECSVFKKKKL